MGRGARVALLASTKIMLMTMASASADKNGAGMSRRRRALLAAVVDGYVMLAIERNRRLWWYRRGEMWYIV